MTDASLDVARTREARADSAARKWLGVALLHLAIAAIGTTSTAKGVFFPALVEDLDLSHASGAALLSVSGMVGSVVALVAAWLMRNAWAPHKVIAGITLLAGTGHLLASASSSYPQLVASYLLMSGQTVMMVAIAFLLSRWFSARRGLALAAVYSGTMTGGVVFTPVISYVVEHFGWRVGYLVIAVLLLVLPPLIYWAIRAPEPARDDAAQREAAASVQGLTFKEALRTRSFWLLLFVYFVFIANTSTYFVHFIAYLQSVGFTPARAALTMSQLFLLAGFAKVLFGYLGDRIDLRRALAISLVGSGLAWGIAVHATVSGPALPAFVLLFGLTYSAPLVLAPLLIARMFGRRDFTVIDTTVTVVGSLLGNLIGPIAAGAVFDRSGSYDQMLIAIAGALLLAALATAFMRRTEESSPAELQPVLIKG
jgi:OFA family oxalate/formate antiporter-like MFS transporter